MNLPSRRRSENLAPHPRVMDDTPTLTAAPLVGDQFMVPDSQPHAEILKRCFVSSAARKDTTLITAGIVTFLEIGEESKGDGTIMVTIISSTYG